MDEQEGKVNIFEETMAHMSYLQIEEAGRKGAIILFPALAVDVYGAYLQSRGVKSELDRKGITSLIAPPFYWGINVATAGFGGSFSCREETMISVLFDAMSSLKGWGFDRVFFINHHMDGGHMKALIRALKKAREEGINACMVLDEFFSKPLGLKGDEPYLLLYRSPKPPEPLPPYLNVHAEAQETSFMWHYLPELVNLEVLRDLKPTNLGFKDLLVWARGGAGARKLTPDGYFGDPSMASPERGREAMEWYGRTAANVIEAYLKGHYAPP
jgi:creatinine amidohydrolase